MDYVGWFGVILILSPILRDIFYVGVIISIIMVVIGVVCTIGTIVLLCLSLSMKGELEIGEIDESVYEKIGNLSTLTLAVDICSNWFCIFFPILAFVFRHNAKRAFNLQNIEEATKNINVSLFMLIVGNFVALALYISPLIVFIIKNS